MLIILNSSFPLGGLQAKEYRDQAVAGGVGDEERRSRAEAVALALSSMLGVSEGDSDWNQSFPYRIIGSFVNK